MQRSVDMKLQSQYTGGWLSVEKYDKAEFTLNYYSWSENVNFIRRVGQDKGVVTVIPTTFILKNCQIAVRLIILFSTEFIINKNDNGLQISTFFI